MTPEAAAFIAIVCGMFLATEALDTLKRLDFARMESKHWFDRYLAESKQLHRITMALASERPEPAPKTKEPRT